MARKGRIISDTGMYHVILRGNDGLFFRDEDYNVFLDTLSTYIKSNSSELYAYSLEKNKVHLAFYTASNISLLLKPLCTSYARYINRVYKRSGKLFYDRYISNPINSNPELLELVAFISNKPCVYSSLDEYKGKKGICQTKKFSKKADLEKIINPVLIVPYTDDYAAMSDKELKKLMLLYYKNSKGSVLKSEQKDFLEFATKNSNLSLSRLSRIFGFSAAMPKKKTELTNKKEDTPKAEAPKKKELSVWLL